MGSKAVQLGVFALVVAGFVVLTLKGSDTSAFIGLVTPILAAVFVVQHLGQQDKVLRQISAQTNGVLDQRIKDGVKAALAEKAGEQG